MKNILYLLIFYVFISNANERKYIFDDKLDDIKASNAWDIYLENEKSSVKFKNDGGINNSGCVEIINTNKSFSAIKHKIKGLKYGKIYRFSAQLKTNDVKDGRGAILSLDMEAHEDQPWNASKFIYGDNDWQEVYLDFTPNRKGEAIICCGLGFSEGTYNGGKAIGKVWYDNIAVYDLDDELFFCESKHFKLYVKPSFIRIKDTKVKNLLNNWDKVYDKYKDLVGGTPFNGDKIIILSTPGMEAGYWALAGNPILWNDGVKNYKLFDNFSNNGDWGFGLMHEIGHDFNIGYSSWNWNDEIFANLRMSYALEKLNGIMSQGNVLYKGDNTNYYKIAYDKTLGSNKAENNGDALHYTFMRIKNKYGWGIFKNAFRELSKMNDKKFENLNSWNKIIFFLNVLSKYAKEDVIKSCYSEKEIQLLKECWK